MTRAFCPIPLCFSWCLGFLGAALSAQAAEAESAEITAYTDRAHPLQLAGFAVTVIYLDAVQRLENRLSEGLPPEQGKAEAQARSLLQSPRGQALQDELLDAYAGLAQAWSQGITKLPAVVMDGHVVYGQPNIAAAVQAIDAFKAEAARKRP